MYELIGLIIMTLALGVVWVVGYLYNNFIEKDESPIPHFLMGVVVIVVGLASLAVIMTAIEIADPIGHAVTYFLI